MNVSRTVMRLVMRAFPPSPGSGFPAAFPSPCRLRAETLPGLKAPALSGETEAPIGTRSAPFRQGPDRTPFVFVRGLPPGRRKGPARQGRSASVNVETRAPAKHEFFFRNCPDKTVPHEYICTKWYRCTNTVDRLSLKETGARTDGLGTYPPSRGHARDPPGGKETADG
jgi:hypothetical protein